MLCLILMCSLPGHAQNAVPPVIGGPPDVVAIVYQQPGAADQVDITYDPAVPQAQALADGRALAQAGGWPSSPLRVQEAAAPVKSQSGQMTSVTFQALGVVQDAAHTFPVDTFARAFHHYRRINLVFFVGPQFQFQGARSYADADIRMALDQHSTSYVYQIEVLHPNFGALPLSQAQTNLRASAGVRPQGKLILGVILGVALLAGLLVYWLASRLTPKEKQYYNSNATLEDKIDGKAESQQKVTTKR